MEKTNLKKMFAALLILIVLGVVIFFLNKFALIPPHASDMNFFVVKTIDLFIALIQAGIIALAGKFIASRIYKSVLNNRSLKKFGLYSVTSPGTLSRKELNDIFTKAKVLCICNISAFGFVHKNFKRIKEATTRADSPLTLKLLLCPPNGSITENVEHIEIENGVRDSENHISSEIDEVINELSSIGTSNIQIKHNENFYFFPYFIVYYSDDTVKSFLNIVIPPRKSADSLCLKSKAYPQNIESEYKNNKKNITLDLIQHFNYTWTSGKKLK